MTAPPREPGVRYPSRLRMLLETRIAHICRKRLKRASKENKKAILSRTPPSLQTYNDCRFRLHPKGNSTESHLWAKGRPPEHPATMFLRDRYKGTAPVIVDVGANAGVFSLPILPVCTPDAQLLAFEPNPVMFARLAINVSLNDFANIRLFEYAIGDAPGEAPLFFPSNPNLGQGRVGVAYKGINSRKGVVVRVRPLLDCLQESGVARVDLLKVDVEGLEDRVIAPLLEGPETLLPKAIYFEDAHDEHWKYPLTQMLEKAGYGRPRRFGHNVFYLLSEDA